MKHIYIIILSLLALAACTKTHAPENPQTSTITYQLSADIQMEIKSTPETAVNVLWYGVFHKQGENYVYMSDMSAFVDITNPESIKVPITLIKDQEYKIAFVAQYKEIKEGNDVYTYLINDKGIMTLNPAAEITPANGDRMDVYVNYDIVSTTSEAKKNITLSRPVAQINLGTSATTLPTNMEITLANVPQSYNIFNPDNNQAYSTEVVTHTFTGAPNGGQLDANGATYTKLATFYVLGSNTLTATLNFQYSGSENVVRTINNVTTAINHKTNIVGKL